MKNNLSIIIPTAFPDKKIKSIGNKSLIRVFKDKTLLEHQICLLKKIYKNPEIIVVGGFEGKKISKLLKTSKNTSGVFYVEHEALSTFNISKSIKEGIRIASNNNILIYNSSIVLHNKSTSTLKNNKRSFLLCSNESKGSIGYIERDNLIVNCFFDIGNNKTYDLLYLSGKDGLVLKELCLSDSIKDNLYLFEIVNLCISNHIRIAPVNIKDKEIKIIDNLSSIHQIQKNIKHYV